MWGRGLGPGLGSRSTVGPDIIDCVHFVGFMIHDHALHVIEVPNIHTYYYTKYLHFNSFTFSPYMFPSDLLEAVQFFPATTRKSLQLTTRALAPAATLIKNPATGTTRAFSMERQLSRDVMRMCTCGTGPKPSDLTFLLAFTGADIGFEYEAAAAIDPSTASPKGSIWVLHQVSGKRKKRGLGVMQGSQSSQIAVKSDEVHCPCITENCYVLSCFSGEAPFHDDIDTRYARMNAVIYKFEHSSELTITRASDGWMTLQENTFLSTPDNSDGFGRLVQSTSANTGMKIRCSAKGVQLSGSAERHSFGPCIHESNGVIVDSTSTKSHMEMNDVSTDTGTHSTSSESILMPPVQCERMISLLESLFAGRELDLSSSSSSPSTNGNKSIIWQGSMSIENSSGTATLHEACLSPSRHRRAAEFAWNNFMGGRLMFLGVEARLQPWAMLVPGVMAAMGDRDGMTNAQQVTGAYALLDQVRRSVEAYLIKGRYEAQQDMIQSAKRRKLCNQAEH